jgi:hypothetical protein
MNTKIAVAALIAIMAVVLLNSDMMGLKTPSVGESEIKQAF